jgi:hypothetical protein
MGPFHVISFPKSGRTWLRVMLDDVGVKANFTHDDSDHVLRRALTDLSPDKSKYLGGRVLLLVRDPRDTAVSGYFQVIRRLNLSATSGELLRDERHGIRKICHFNLQWFGAGPGMDRFAILTYEQMHRAPADALAAVADFAGTALDSKTAERVASNRTFARMRAAEASGELAQLYGKVFFPGGNPESFKVRRGVVGGYRDYLSDVDQSYCEMILAETDYWSHCERAVSKWSFERLRSTGADREARGQSGQA